MANAIEKIQSEHRDYARVLACLNDTMRYLRDYDGKRMTAPGAKIRARARPNLDLLTAIVYYVRVFPDKFHHPKEERHLFRAVRRRSPESGTILDRLVRQHAHGERLIHALAVALKAYEKHYPNGLNALEAAAAEFIASQRDHMRLEEQTILPVAKAVLSREDWRDIDDAFTGNADPMFGENLETAFRVLHDHIVAGGVAA